MHKTSSMLLGSSSDVSSDEASESGDMETTAKSKARSTKGMDSKKRVRPSSQDETTDSPKKKSVKKEKNKSKLDEPKLMIEDVSSTSDIEEEGAGPKSKRPARRRSLPKTKSRRAAASRPVSYYEGDLDNFFDEDEDGGEEDDADEQDSGAEDEFVQKNRNGKSKRQASGSQISANSRRYFYE
ncbi:hypothetical protein Ciccas_003580 [Cichlidogyrus casuarinus]|uniref:Uncharacterized protein n=1 Tax=Cichlidogyrus casuarinus TaxID=1844966 RepID=A0ABD2QEU8_9PLAT